MVNNKAQNEIVGFVLIIVIVSIAGMVFLGLTIGRGEPITQESVKISDLLSASMYYTTDCAVNYLPNYKDGQDLIKSCWNNEDCLNEKTACEVLNSTLEKLITESLDVHPDKPHKAYELIIYHRSLSTDVADQPILEASEGNYGNCTSEIGGSHSIAISGLSSGVINVELSVCRSG